MTIGGLTVGVTPIDMAHAYETLAHGGRRVSGTLAEHGQPVAIQEVDAGSHVLPDGNHKDVNHVRSKAVLPQSIAETETSMLETVVQYGTGKAAAIGQFAAGKTGTTSNYGDAWFVGWDSKYTVAVWVGYPDKLIPMTTSFNGGPVLGGTFPALIWHDFMTSALGIDKTRAEHAAQVALEKKEGKKVKAGSGEGEEEGSSESSPLPTEGGGSSGSGSSGKGGGKSSAPSKSEAGGGGEGGGSGNEGSAPPEQAPTPAAPKTEGPAPSSSPAPESSSPSSPTGGVSPGG
jgi:penicillin-binding protein 1A